MTEFLIKSTPNRKKNKVFLGPLKHMQNAYKCIQILIK
jgi:hypothetical protein